MKIVKLTMTTKNKNGEPNQISKSRRRKKWHAKLIVWTGIRNSLRIIHFPWYAKYQKHIESVILMCSNIKILMNSLLYQKPGKTPFLSLTKHLSIYLFFSSTTTKIILKVKSMPLKHTVFGESNENKKYIYGIHQHKFYTARCAHAHRQFRFASILFHTEWPSL